MTARTVTNGDVNARDRYLGLYQVVGRQCAMQEAEQGISDKSRCIVPTIVQLELSKWLVREAGEEQADQVIAYTQKCTVVPLDTAIALLAAELRREHKLATADAIVYSSITDFVARMEQSEGDHLDAFVRFIAADTALLAALSLDPNKHIRRYRDGAIVEYDFAAHSLKAELPAGASVLIVAPGSVTVQTKSATVQADDVTLDAKQTTVTGNMLVKGAFVFESGMSGKSGASGGPAMVISGTVAVSDDVIAGGKSGAHHTHKEQGDGNNVSEPI